MCAHAGLNSYRTEVHRAKASPEVLKVINYICYLFMTLCFINETTIYCKGMCLILRVEV